MTKNGALSYLARSLEGFCCQEGGLPVRCPNRNPRKRVLGRLKMGRKKKPKPEDPEQYAAFVKIAEQIQAEDADERFEDAMKRIVHAQPTKPSKNES